MIRNTILIILAFLISFACISFASAPMDADDFQSYVYDYLITTYKDREFRKSDDKLIIQMGEVELGLQNIFKIYKEENLTKHDLDKLLNERFKEILNRLDTEEMDEISDWEKARHIIRPQIAPIEYKEKVPLVYDDLDSMVIVGYVIDQKHSYKYVTFDDIKRWSINKDTLSAVAINNLDKASKGISMHASLEEEKFIIIQVLDGYDAARLLIPELRQFIVSKLGSPFYAAIPNRDFLIMWSTDNSQNFIASTSAKVKSDFESQPYPLTPNIFLVTKSKIEVVE